MVRWMILKARFTNGQRTTQKKNGLQLNPDYDVVVQAIKGLALNKREYGAQYCGCRRVTGNPEKDSDLISVLR